MKDSFRWPQAKNMLLAGVCQSVEYAPDQNCCNSFELHKGVVYRRFDYSNALEDVPLRAYEERDFADEEYLFQVKE